MEFKKKKGFTGKYMTQADRERLAKVDHDPRNDWQKCKYLLVLGKKGLKQEICIKVYGKDEDEIKQHIKEHLEFFKSNDKNWTILRTENLKQKEESETEEE